MHVECKVSTCTGHANIHSKVTVFRPQSAVLSLSNSLRMPSMLRAAFVWCKLHAGLLKHSTTECRQGDQDQGQELLHTRGISAAQNTAGHSGQHWSTNRWTCSHKGLLFQGSAQLSSMLFFAAKLTCKPDLGSEHMGFVAHANNQEGSCHASCHASC